MVLKPRLQLQKVAVAVEVAIKGYSLLGINFQKMKQLIWVY